MSHDETAAPRFTAPAHACDAHFHVFGPVDRYPAGTADLRYALPYAPLADYRRLAAKLGIERMVFVQPSAYGRDNRCMLDAMAEVGPVLCRGVVDIDEDLPDAELARLHAIGVRGVRINVSPIKPHTPGFGQTMVPRILKLDARLAEMGWHLDFLGPGWLTSELMPTMKKMRCAYSVAHMGMYLAREGPAQPGFQALLDLLKNGDGRCYVKFTGTYRMATLPHMADALPMAQAVIAAAPDRIIWGSDYPHLSFADKVGSVQLFNLLADWAPDPAVRAKILVENPARLFGF